MILDVCSCQRRFTCVNSYTVKSDPNIPENPDLAIDVGKRICQELLEPLQDKFGRLAIRSAYRSKEVNGFGNEQMRANKKGYACASNEANYAGHIWDERDSEGNMGGTVCLVVPSFAEKFNKGTSWTELAWWIHDNLPYSSLFFFPINAAFNITWNECPKRQINSFVEPKGTLTNPGMDNHEGDHSTLYPSLI